MHFLLNIFIRTSFSLVFSRYSIYIMSVSLIVSSVSQLYVSACLLSFSAYSYLSIAALWIVCPCFFRDLAPDSRSVKKKERPRSSKKIYHNIFIFLLSLRSLDLRIGSVGSTVEMFPIQEQKFNT